MPKKCGLGCVWEYYLQNMFASHLFNEYVLGRIGVKWPTIVDIT